jgi:hypothetical protein
VQIRPTARNVTAIAWIRTAIIEGTAETGEETEGGEVAEEVLGIEDRGLTKRFSILFGVKSYQLFIFRFLN